MPGFLDDLLEQSGSSGSGGFLDDLLESPGSVSEPPELGFFEDLFARFRRGATTLPASALNAVDFAANLPITPTWIANQVTGGETLRRMREDVERGRKSFEEAAAEVEVGAPSEYLLGRGAQAAAEGLPQMGAIMLSGAAAPVTAAGLIGGASREEALERGVDPDIALAKAIIEAGVSAPLEALGAGRARALFAKLPKKLQGEWLKRFGSALVAEPLTELGQEAVAVAGESATGREFAEGEVAERLAVAPLAGAVTAGGLGAAGAATSRIRSSAAADRLLTVHGGLTPEMHRMKENSRQIHQAAQVEAHQLSDLVEGEKRRLVKAGADALQLDEVSDGFLKTGQDLESVPETLREPLVAMRQSIDAWTDRLLESDLLTPEQRANLEAHKASGEDPLNYLRRSYRIFDDPKGQLEASRESGAWARAREFLVRTEQASNETEAEVMMQSTFDTIERMQRGGEQPGTDIGTVSRAPFITRKDVPQEMRDLYGEYKAPEVSYLITIDRMANTLTKAELYRSLLQSGQAQRLFVEKIPEGADPNDWITLWNPEKKGSIQVAETSRVAQDLLMAMPTKEGETHPLAANRPAVATVDPESGEAEAVVLPELWKTKGPLHVDRNLFAALEAGVDSVPFTRLAQSNNALVRGYAHFLRAQGIVKGSLTTGSIQTHSRNLQSNIIALAAGGNWAALPLAWSARRGGSNAVATALAKEGVLTGKKFKRLAPSEELKADAVKAVRLGVTTGSVDARDVNLYVEGIDQSLGRWEARKPSAWRRAARKAWDWNPILGVGRPYRKAYTIEDDIPKLLAWKAEKEKLFRAYSDQITKGEVTVEDIEVEAAEITKSTMQNYDRMPRIVQHFRSTPFLAPFVAFPAASIINLKNQLRRGLQEIGAIDADAGSLLEKAGANSSTAAWGALRLGSTAGTVLGAASMAEMIRAAVQGSAEDTWLEKFVGALDLPEEPEQKKQLNEDILRTAPFYARDSELLPVRKDGTVVYYIDLSFSDYFNAAKRPFLAALRAPDFDEAAFDEGIKAALEPFFAKDILTGAVGEIVFNRDRYGNEIFQENDRIPDYIRKMTEHLAYSRIGPIKSMRRLFKAANGEADPYTQRGYDLGTELFALMGPRITRIDFRDALRREASRTQGSLRNASRALGELRSGQPLSRNQVEATVSAVEQGARAAYQGLQEVYLAARRQGVSEEEAELYMDGVIRNTGLPKYLREQLIAGESIDAVVSDWLQKRATDVNKGREQSMNGMLQSWRLENEREGTYTPEAERLERHRLAEIWAPISF